MPGGDWSPVIVGLSAKYPKSTSPCLVPRSRFQPPIVVGPPRLEAETRGTRDAPLNSAKMDPDRFLEGIDRA